MAMLFIIMAWQYPNSFIPIGRKNMTEIEIGTFLSFLEVLDHMNFVQDKHYRIVGGNKLRIVFANNSIIQFTQLDITKDREWGKIKSINATSSGIDEVDGVAHSGFTMFSARTGRKNKNDQPDVTICTCNPNEGWVKDLVYIPWRKGKLPEDQLVIEFKMEDSFLYPTGFYDKYKDNPKQWRERYLNNNWDYLDDDQSLFKSKILDSIMVANYDSDAKQCLGIDVADGGDDRTVMAHTVGNVLVNIKIYTKEDIERLATPEERKSGRIPRGHVIGREAIKYCMQHGIGYSDVAFDVIGVGASLRDYFISQEFYAKEFRAGAKSDGDFDMLRSEVGVNLADEMELGNFFIYEGCPHTGDLKKELLFHQFETKDKTMCLESKKKLKIRLGKSPDIADAVFIDYWAINGRIVGSFHKEPDTIIDREEIEEANKPITSGLINKIF